MSEKKSRRGLIAVIVVLVVIAAAGGLWKMGMLPLGSQASTGDSSAADSTGAVVESSDNDDEKEIVAVPVELARVTRRGIDAYYKAASVIEADRLVDLVTKVPGRVHAVNVEEGDWVKKGQILGELENDREQVQLRQADLKLEEQARVLARNQSMLDEGLISDQEFDTARSAYDLAEADRDLARITLEDTRIRAPFKGQVTDRKVVPGQQLNATVALFTLADFSPMRVKVHLPENVASKVSAGQRVLITPDAIDKTLEGRVERVAPVVDPTTSTVRVTMILNDGDDLARVGGFVKVRITTETRTDALSIPKLALIEEGSLRSVFVAEADTVRKLEVRTGLYDEQYVEILDGVEQDWFVVQVGQGGLRDGTRIDPLNGMEIGWGALFEEDSMAVNPEDSVLARAE
jgi:membrane fusion protein (multidrug efflux system)